MTIKSSKKHTKRLFSFLLSILLALSCFPGCAAKQTNQSLSVMHICYDWSDTSYFVQRTFSENHPELEFSYEEVVLSRMSESETELFFKKLTAEIMAGRSADVFYFDFVAMEYFDLYKSQLAGAFTDLSPFMEADSAFEQSNYARNILDAARLDGKQYILPLTYTLDGFITAKELLKQYNVDLEHADTGLQQIEELVSYWDRSRKTSDSPQFFLDWDECTYYLPALELYKFDFAGKEVLLNGEGLQKLADGWKNFYPFRSIYYKSPGTLNVEAMLNGDMLACAAGIEPKRYYHYYNAVSSRGENLVFYPIKTMDGGISARLYSCLAVSGDSKNKQNAWKYIRYYLSDAVQVQADVQGVGVPPGYIPQSALSIPVYLPNWEAYYTANGRTKEEYESFCALQKQITSVNIHTQLDRSIEAIIKEYVTGAATFETMNSKVNNMLTLYVSE